LQRDARLLHVSKHVLRLRGTPTLKAAITHCSPKDVTNGAGVRRRVARVDRVSAMTTMSEHERSERFEAQRQRIREQHLRPADERSPSSARGLHHTALVSSDVEQTVRFYQDLLEFPLTELIENRDY